MPTATLTIASTWTSAATGATNVLIPAIDRGFRWAITTGSAPAMSPDVCPFVKAGDQLSLQLAAGETLYVTAFPALSTTVTTGA